MPNSRFAATFSGRYGDIIWSMATVKELARVTETAIDFYCMPQYTSLLDLLNRQSYISKAEVLENWICIGSPWGDQPWKAPVADGYEGVWHLTYRRDPKIPLIQVIISEHNMNFAASPVPFLDGMPDVPESRLKELGPYDFVYAFNTEHRAQKLAFAERLAAETGLRGLELGQQSWGWTARLIKEAKFFLGCRSANYALAHGVGQKVLVYEPMPWRREERYGCPYGTEVMPAVENFEGFKSCALRWSAS